MQTLELADSRLLDRILFSSAERRRLCQLVLATYRVELTRTLSRMAADGFEDGDLELVHEIARRIDSTALSVRLIPVRAAAVELQALALAGDCGTKREQGGLLVAGLALIDRILESARAVTGTPPPGAAPLN